MRCRDCVGALALVGFAALPAMAQQRDTAARRAVAAEDSARAVQLRTMVEQIARERPPQAEAAARDVYRILALQQATLDSLRRRSLAEYWAEVAQMTVQREMLLHQQDAARQQLMAQLFATEARARALQRDYRDAAAGAETMADTARDRTIRRRLEQLLTRHFAAEDSLRELEIADVERRLAQIRADTERRRRERAELVRQQVEQILRDATKPPE